MRKLRIVLGAAAALFASAAAAHADPVTITLAVSTAWATATTAAATALTAVGLSAGASAFAVKVFVQIAGGLILGAISQALAPKGKAPLQSGTRVSMQVGEVNPASFIMGFGCTPGELLYHNSWDRPGNDTPSEFYVQVIELSDLPASLDRVFINGEWATLKPLVTTGDLIGHHPVAGYEKDGGDKLWVRFYDGSQTTADPYLVAKFGTHHDRPWTSDMVGLGLTYAIVTAALYKTVHSQKPDCKFEISPVHYDRRKDSSAGGVGAQRWGDRRTWRPSRNPVVLIDNILRGIHDPITGEFIWGGQGLANFHLPASVWFAAMNACDAVRTTTAGTEPEYRAGLEVLVSDEPADVIDEFLKACVGRVAEQAGQWHVKVGPPGPAVYDFTDADVILTSADTFKPVRPLDALFNGIAAQYVDPASGWQAKDAPPRISAAYVVEDGGKQNVAGVTYPAVPFARQVQRLMATALKDERRQRTHSLVLPPECVALGPLDDVSYSSVENGYSHKAFAVEFVEDLPDGTVALAMRERDPADYDYAIGDELPTAVGYRPPLPRPAQLVDFSVEPWTIVDSTGRARTPAIRINWTVRAGVSGIRYMVRNEETLEAVQNEGFASRKPAATTSGSLVANGNPVTANGAAVSYQVFTDVAAGFAIISGEAIKALTLYGVRAMYEPAEEGRAWSAWLTVTTPDVRLVIDDFADEVREVIADAKEAADVAGAQAREALEKANDVEALVGGISEEMLTDLQEIADQLAGISTGDIQEIRGIGMAGLRRGGWAIDPTFNEWTPGANSTPVHYATSGFAAFAVRQASALNAPFPTSALVSVPAGANGPVQLFCESAATGHTAAADPKADYVVLEALFRIPTGDVTDARLRVEWKNSASGIWTAGHAFGLQNCTGRFVTDWGFAVDPDRVQSRVVVWQRPVTASAVRIALVVKAVAQTRASDIRIDYLNFGAATAADIEAVTAKGYADAKVLAYKIEIEGPTGAIAALGSAVRSEFGAADAAVNSNIIALTSDVESMAAAITSIETNFGGTNLVKNPQFDDGVQAAGVAPRNWDDWDAGMTVVQKTAPGTGSAGLQNAPTKFVANFPLDAAGHDLRAHRPVPIRVGERVEASAQFAGAGSPINRSVALWVRWYDTNGALLSNAFGPSVTISATAWGTVTPPIFTAPAGAVTFSLYVRRDGSGTGGVYFTNVQSRIVDNASYASAQTALAAASTATSSVASWRTDVSAHFADMDAMVSATATAYASAQMAASTYVVKFLNGAFKLVGWNDTSGSGSAIVLDADNVIAPGTLSAGSMVITDLGYNMVPDDQLQSAQAWLRNDTAWSIIKDTTGSGVDSQGESRWTRSATDGEAAPRHHGLWFPVRPGQRLQVSYQMAPIGTGTYRGYMEFQYADKDGGSAGLIAIDPPAVSSSNAVYNGLAKVVVPSGAYKARCIFRVVVADTTKTHVRFWSPKVISNEDASVLITPDGAFISQLSAETAWISELNVVHGTFSELSLGPNAVTVSVEAKTAAAITISTAGTTVQSLSITSPANATRKGIFAVTPSSAGTSLAMYTVTLERRVGAGAWTVLEQQDGVATRNSSERYTPLIYAFADHATAAGVYEYRMRATDVYGLIDPINLRSRVIQLDMFKR